MGKAAGVGKIKMQGCKLSAGVAVTGDGGWGGKGP